mmetsp:Transcript_28004/g.45498  ORF Transcript_28004/g.45498 Transcript_28004/m.45498 type:complete len:139 (+) Transcript_28004:262-678(+)
MEKLDDDMLISKMLNALNLLFPFLPIIALLLAPFYQRFLYQLHTLLISTNLCQIQCTFTKTIVYRGSVRSSSNNARTHCTLLDSSTPLRRKHAPIKGVLLPSDNAFGSAPASNNRGMRCALPHTVAPLSGVCRKPGGG